MPVAFVGSTGGLLYGLNPFICGGITDNKLMITDCFIFDVDNDPVVSIATTMAIARAWAGSIVVGSKQDTLFVVGGGYFQQSEYNIYVVTLNLFLIALLEFWFH